MLFDYEALTDTGEKKIGSVDASSKDLAIAAIQRRGYIISSMSESKEKRSLMNISFLGKTSIPMKDIVIMSRQMSTLFESQVAALKAFNLLAENTSNKNLTKILEEVAEDIKSGIYISQALAKHKEAFSDFYVNMVKSGEESGKLTQCFSYLADYLDRQYQLTSKTKNALIYPAFVIGVFVIVMIMMFTFIVPKLAAIIKESGMDIPFSTQIIMNISDLFVSYGLFLLAGVVIGIVALVRYARTPHGRLYIDRLKISVPVFKNIYSKLYLSRISDNMDTMLSSSIPIVRSIELTSAVVGNRVFEEVLKDIAEDVKSGSSLSDSFGKHHEIPSIMSGMIRVGEETGSLGNILKTLGHFYSREVNEAVDTMVSLIEPIMIVMLGLGVGVLLSSILMPIYNIAGGVQ
jgi:type IV pilus assembly protein PilC